MLSSPAGKATIFRGCCSSLNSACAYVRGPELNVPRQAKRVFLKMGESVGKRSDECSPGLCIQYAQNVGVASHDAAAAGVWRQQQ